LADFVENAAGRPIHRLRTGAEKLGKKLFSRLRVSVKLFDVAVVGVEDVAPSVGEPESFVARETNAVPQTLERRVHFSQQTTCTVVMIRVLQKSINNFFCHFPSNGSIF